VLRQSYNVDIGYIYRYLKLSVLWLHVLFSHVMRVDRALCTIHDIVHTHNRMTFFLNLFLIETIPLCSNKFV